MGKREKALIRETAKESRKKQRQIRNKHRKQRCKDAFKLSPAYEKFFKDFNNELKATGLELRDVGGDGNCLFRSISDQIEGDQGLHEMYRKEACRHMRENEQFYTLYLDEDEDGNLTQYLREMATDGQWGGNLQLQALSQCLNMNIVIHRVGLQQTIIEPWNQKKDKNKKRFTIHLAYFQEQQFEHYSSIRILGDQSNTPAVSSFAKLPKYKYLDFVNHRNDEEYDQQKQLLRLQMKQLGLEYQEEYQQQYQKQQEEPFPNYPRNKKCKCNSGQPYKNCCYKEFQKRRAMKHR